MALLPTESQGVQIGGYGKRSQMLGSWTLESYLKHFLPNRSSMKSETTLTLSFTSLLSKD